jgi:hypothetical protein
MTATLVLIGIFALLVLGPRRRGYTRGTRETYLWMTVLAFMLVAAAVAWGWQRLLES